jgi:hypothetical protein
MPEPIAATSSEGLTQDDVVIAKRLANLRRGKPGSFTTTYQFLRTMIGPVWREWPGIEIEHDDRLRETVRLRLVEFIPAESGEPTDG